MNGHRLGQNHPAPSIGEGSHALLKEFGYDEATLNDLKERSILAGLD